MLLVRLMQEPFSELIKTLLQIGNLEAGKLS